MRIGIDIRHLCAANPTGIGQYSREVITRLLRYTDFEWTLFASGSASSLEHIPTELLQEAPHITIHRHQSSNRALNIKLRNHQVTLEELVASPVDAWFFPNIDFIQTQKPYIITAHDLSFTFLPECYSPKSRVWHHLVQPKRLYTEASHILAVSNSTATDLTHVYGINPTKTTVIPLAAGAEFSPHALPSDRHTLLKYGLKGSYLLSLSTIEPRKNHIGMLRGYESWCKKTQSSVPLVIAGGHGYGARKVLRAIKKSPLRKQIVLLGYIAREDRPTLLRHAKAVLFPSLYEGFGLPVREALQSGTPVLTSNNSGMLEHTGEHILHVSPWHVQDIATGIEGVLAMKKDKKTVASFATWDDIASQTHDVFKKHFTG